MPMKLPLDFIQDVRKEERSTSMDRRAWEHQRTIDTRKGQNGDHNGTRDQNFLQIQRQENRMRADRQTQQTPREQERINQYEQIERQHINDFLRAFNRQMGNRETIHDREYKRHWIDREEESAWKNLYLIQNLNRQEKRHGQEWQKLSDQERRQARRQLQKEERLERLDLQKMLKDRRKVWEGLKLEEQEELLQVPEARRMQEIMGRQFREALEENLGRFLAQMEQE